MPLFAALREDCKFVPYFRGLSGHFGMGAGQSGWTAI